MSVGFSLVGGLSRAALCVAAVSGVAACGPQGKGVAGNLTPRDLPPQGQLASLPLGDLAGAAESTAPNTLENPYEGNKQAVAQGHKLFIAMNCAGCHGYDGAGGMGPDLTDKYWRYGGTPAAIYRSIFEGRPQGMPAWGRALPAQEIWKIVAFVETFGGSFAPSLRHAGLQGDHDVTSIAPDVLDLGPTFNEPRPLAVQPPPILGSPGTSVTKPTNGALRPSTGGLE